MFANAYRMMAHRNLVAPGDPRLARRRRELAEYLHSLTRRLERIQVLVADERMAYFSAAVNKNKN